MKAREVSLACLHSGLKLAFKFANYDAQRSGTEQQKCTRLWNGRTHRDVFLRASIRGSGFIGNATLTHGGDDAEQARID
jgi:hypothetical protein